MRGLVPLIALTVCLDACAQERDSSSYRAPRGADRTFADEDPGARAPSNSQRDTVTLHEEGDGSFNRRTTSRAPRESTPTSATVITVGSQSGENDPLASLAIGATRTDGTNDDISSSIAGGSVGAIPAFNDAANPPHQVRFLPSWYDLCYFDAVERSAGCAGRNEFGAGGALASGGRIETLTKVASLAGQIVEFGIAGNNACALLANGSVNCWGVLPMNVSQQAPGVVAPTATHVPLRLEFPSPSTLLGVGPGDTCVALVDGKIACIGDYQGTGPQRHYRDPALYELPGTKTLGIAVGQNHVCAARETGDVYCWGRQLGGGEPGQALAPFPIVRVGNVVDFHMIVTTQNPGSATDRFCVLFGERGISCFTTNGLHALASIDAARFAELPSIGRLINFVPGPNFGPRSHTTDSSLIPTFEPATLRSFMNSCYFGPSICAIDTANERAVCF